MTKQPDLSVTIGKLHLKNPVISASGTFGYGTEFGDFFDISMLGAIVIKGVTLDPTEGNRPPRIVETPAGMLNSIGLQNPGVDTLVHHIIPRIKEVCPPVIANICGSSVSEYVEIARRLEGVEDIAAVEINVSCPNLKKGGVIFGTDPSMTHEVVSSVRKVTSHTLITKLSPNVTDIVTLGRAACEGGSDALSLVNTFKALSVDADTRKPRLGAVTGGLSGPAIRPIALFLVWETVKALDVPVIGMGGIADVNDALEFLIVGAAAIALGSINLVDPRAAVRIVEGLEKYLVDNNIASIGELIGTLKIGDSA